MIKIVFVSCLCTLMSSVLFSQTNEVEHLKDTIIVKFSENDFYIIDTHRTYIVRGKGHLIVQDFQKLLKRSNETSRKIAWKYSKPRHLFESWLLFALKHSDLENIATSEQAGEAIAKQYKYIKKTEVACELKPAPKIVLTKEQKAERQKVILQKSLYSFQYFSCSLKKSKPKSWQKPEMLKADLEDKCRENGILAESEEIYQLYGNRSGISGVITVKINGKNIKEEQINELLNVCKCE